MHAQICVLALFQTVIMCIIKIRILSRIEYISKNDAETIV